jgi:hypothetical protein
MRTFQDVSEIGQADLATECIELAASVSRWVLTGHKDSTDGWEMNEAIRWLRSPITVLKEAGARIAGNVNYTQPAQGKLLIDAFSTLDPKARRLAVKYAVRFWRDDMSIALVVMGLRDPAPAVRRIAAEITQEFFRPEFTEVIREQLVLEKNAKVREALEVANAYRTKGYWLSPAKDGIHALWLRNRVTCVPSTAVDEVGEVEAVRRERSHDPSDKAWIEAHWAPLRATIAATQRPPKPSDGARLDDLRTLLATSKSPFVEARRFLDGNGDEGSIACNTDPHPGLDAIRKVVTAAVARADVGSIMVEIKEVPEGADWPYTDRLLVLTKASVNDVKKWFKKLKPDIVTATSSNVPPGATDGLSWVEIWWD